jgi:predicted transcriptional regulator
MSASPAIAALPSPPKELVAATAAPHAGASEKEHAEVQAWIERVARGEVRPEAFAASVCDWYFVGWAHAGMRVGT